MNDIEKAIEILNDTEVDMKYTKNEINLANLMGIIALKKRIPKKPYKDMGGYYCNSCHEWIDEMQIGKNDYCVNCGQKLFWGEV